jgi:hypothetical protein
MTRTAAALLVLALAGSPVARVVCLVECQHDRVTFGHCHAGMETSEGLLISAGYGCNGPSLDGSLYFGEARALPSAAVVAATSLLTVPDLHWTSAPLALPGASRAWLKPPVVMRL